MTHDKPNMPDTGMREIVIDNLDDAIKLFMAMQDGGHFILASSSNVGLAVSSARRLTFIRKNADRAPGVNAGLLEDLKILKPYLEKTMRRMEVNKRITMLATPESHAFYDAMHSIIELITAAEGGE